MGSSKEDALLVAAGWSYSLFCLFYLLAEAKQEQRQQNNQWEDNSLGDSCLVAEEPNCADENSANALQGERSPFEDG